MKNATYAVILGLLVSVLLVVAVSSVARRVLAAGPTLQQQAADELPEVQQTIEDTQPDADLNASARTRKALLLDCVQKDQCGPLAPGTTPAL